jgi:hypothetical protein
MSYHWPAETDFALVELDAFDRGCSVCGRRMHICDHRYRRVHTLEGPLGRRGGVGARGRRRGPGHCQGDPRRPDQGTGETRGRTRRRSDRRGDLAPRLLRRGRRHQAHAELGDAALRGREHDGRGDRPHRPGLLALRSQAAQDHPPRQETRCLPRSPECDSRSSITEIGESSVAISRQRTWLGRERRSILSVPTQCRRVYLIRSSRPPAKPRRRSLRGRVPSPRGSSSSSR